MRNGEYKKSIHKHQKGDETTGTLCGPVEQGTSVRPSPSSKQQEENEYTIKATTDIIRSKKPYHEILTIIFLYGFFEKRDDKRTNSMIVGNNFHYMLHRHVVCDNGLSECSQLQVSPLLRRLLTSFVIKIGSRLPSTVAAVR